MNLFATNALFTMLVSFRSYRSILRLLVLFFFFFAVIVLFPFFFLFLDLAHVGAEIEITLQ